jgi:hypothetical protein
VENDVGNIAEESGKEEPTACPGWLDPFAHAFRRPCLATSATATLPALFARTACAFGWFDLGDVALLS